MSERVTVNRLDLDHARNLVLGRVIHALDLGLSLDDLDAQRIREASEILGRMVREAKAIA